MKAELATPDTEFKIGQHIKLTTITHGEAVYDRKGNIVNQNWRGVKSEYTGIVTEIYKEGGQWSTVIKCKTIKKSSVLDFFSFYPMKIDKNNIVEILPSPTTKMYIAVLDEFPDYMTPTLVAHSMLGAHLQFEHMVDYKKWLEESFKKCVIRVNQKEFDKIASLQHVYLGHENKTLDGRKSCAIVMPRENLPNVLKYAKLWKPKHEV